MRFTYRAAGPVAAVAVLTLLGGCSRTQQDWSAAQQAGTPQAYGNFAARHPDSELAAVARQRLAELTEQAAWQQATRANTAAAYRQYLAKYPTGSWSQDARIRVESRSMATVEAPGTGSTVLPATPSTADQASLARATAAPITAAHAIAAQSAAEPEPGRFAVQLGAFSNDANAHAAWTQLSSKLGTELRGLAPRIVPVVSSGRRLYRLEVRVASQAAGRGLCRQLQQHSQGCLLLP